MPDIKYALTFEEFLSQAILKHKNHYKRLPQCIVMNKNLLVPFKSMISTYVDQYNGNFYFMEVRVVFRPNIDDITIISAGGNLVTL